MDAKVLLKIKKLLSLAKSSNPHEAAAALQRAQSLMAKHGVGTDDIALTDCDKRSLSFTKEKLCSYEVKLLNTINAAFGVQCIISYLFKNGKFVAHANFIGISPQPELAVYCMDVLYRQLQKSRADYVAQLNNNCKRLTKIKRGDDFAKGWVFQVHSNISEFAMTPQQKELVDKYQQQEFKSTSKQSGVDRNKGKERAQDIASGINSAKNVRLDRPMHGKETPKLTGANI